MSTTTKPMPRFVPTLTEVVDPSTLSHLSSQAQPDIQTLVQLVQQQIQPVFEQRLNEELDRLVLAALSKQRAELNSQMKDEIDRRIHLAVLDVLAHLEPIKLKK